MHFVIEQGCTKCFMHDKTFLHDSKVSFNRMNILSFSKTAHFREHFLRIRGNSELFESWTNPQFWQYSLLRSHNQPAFAKFHSLWRSNWIEACSSWVQTIYYLQFNYLYWGNIQATAIAPKSIPGWCCLPTYHLTSLHRQKLRTFRAR